MKLYRERLHPAPSIFFYVALVIPASIIVFIPVNPEGEVSGLAIGIATGLVLCIGVIALFVRTSPIIEVTAETLRVCRAMIPRDLFGRVDGYGGSDATEQRGTALDARVAVHPGLDQTRDSRNPYRPPGPYPLLACVDPTP